ncbi:MULTISPECIES: hypothetical protein [Streptomyces]|uniref:Uncharacterized protein n=1 Tax=Streptomyces indiaensis TaxID=284033 RepID=A0ABP5QF25_9ACTN|nr:hypothetical protein [Streptomyces indiaensis]MCF1644131.1 hypothetical protein [Streptomyces indiaensis]
MTVPKPLKIALFVVLAYALIVLMLRYRRDGMDWDQALLLGLLVTPLAFLLSWGRDRLMGKARGAGERARARRRGEAAE